eukprot:3651027-Pyramimonas_sp.AAC.1
MITVDESQTCISGRCMLRTVAYAESWGVQQQLLGQNSAGMLLTGSSAAFPSILIGFMSDVSNAMK